MKEVYVLYWTDGFAVGESECWEVFDSLEKAVLNNTHEFLAPSKWREIMPGKTWVNGEYFIDRFEVK